MSYVKERFWSKVDKTADGCWTWNASIDHAGYGRFKVGRKHVGAHRIAYRIVCGEIPEGMLVCHRCDNRKCVRPDHLFIGTQTDNLLDMYGKGRRDQRLINRSASAKASREA